MRRIRSKTWWGALAVAIGVLAIGGSDSLRAQGTIGIPPGGGTPGNLGVSVPDVTVTPGETFTIAVHIDDPNPIDLLVFNMFTDPVGVQFLSWQPGAGLQAYIDAVGQPPNCDVFVDPMSFFGFMFLIPPGFDSTIYGTEFFRITAVANGPVGNYPLEWMADASVGSAMGTATVTVSSDPVERLMRGDVDDDGLCNITDAVHLIGYLFADGTDPNCLDAADVDDTGTVNISDVVNLLSGLFGGGFPLDDTCQEDQSADSLGTCDRDDCL